MKTALIIRHVPREGVAGFRAPIEAAGYVIDRVDVIDPEFHAVDLVAPDLVVMMGGPMGVYEQETYPWIRCQLGRLAKRLEAERPTLGVCFGAQMMAAALGAEVYAGPAKEIGFGPIRIHVEESPLRHLADVPVLHWHGDTFTRPEGTEVLASSELYPHQAFRRGPNLLALQFHAEMGEDERFEDWIAQDFEYLAAAGHCQKELRAAHDTHGPGAVAAGRAMIAEWLAGLSA